MATVHSRCHGWPYRMGPLPEPPVESIIARASELAAKFRLEKPMHYRNGREAKNGDLIVQLGSEGKITALGVLHSATPGNDYCNGSIAPIQNPAACACMCDCLHLDDVAALLKEKGLDVRPPGK